MRRKLIKRIEDAKEQKMDNKGIEIQVKRQELESNKAIKLGRGIRELGEI
jgi:hypothetical protein